MNILFDFRHQTHHIPITRVCILLKQLYYNGMTALYKHLTHIKLASAMHKPVIINRLLNDPWIFRDIYGIMSRSIDFYIKKDTVFNRLLTNAMCLMWDGLCDIPCKYNKGWFLKSCITPLQPTRCVWYYEFPLNFVPFWLMSMGPVNKLPTNTHYFAQFWNTIMDTVWQVQGETCVWYVLCCHYGWTTCMWHLLCILHKTLRCNGVTVLYWYLIHK